jgi:hypothetical protein
MRIRLLFNTRGRYVAFVSNGHVFSPQAEWIGFVRPGNEIYGKNGKHLGFILADDRVARNTMAMQKIPLIPPIPPFPPIPPIPPIPRLPKLPLPPPYKDVFE